MRTRNEPEVRKAEILAAALRVAERRGGWRDLTRERVAIEAQCSDGLVSRYFGTMVNFRRAIMREAIRVNNAAIVAQGIGADDRAARKAPPELKSQALALLAG